MPVSPAHLRLELTLPEPGHKTPHIALLDEHGTELTRIATSEPAPCLPIGDASVLSVDAIDVLEHVHAPREMLHEISRILKPGGTLLVAVPNFGSWEARWSGKGWFHLDVPRHLTQFTLKTLRTSLDEAGLTLKEVNFFSTEYDFFSFIQSAQNKMGLRHNLLYNLLRTRSAKVVDMGNEAGTTAWRDTIIALATAPFLAIVSVFYMPMIAAMRRGATIAAYAVKR